MDELYRLKEMLMDELNEYAQKGKMSAGDLDVVDKLAHATKNICKVIEAAEEEDYSQRNSYYNGGGMSGNSYRGGNSRGRGMGGNSQARGRNARRDSMGRYSGHDGMMEIAEMIRGSMADLPQNVQREAGALLAKIEDNM